MNVTRDVLHALRRDLYPPTRYLWAEEVPTPYSEGDTKARRMDAATIDCLRRPHYIEGFEVKVSRADWLNDKDGSKSQEARKAVDRFWFVFGAPSIYKVDEVPEGCGIIHINDDVATIVRTPAYPDLGTLHEFPFGREMVRLIALRSLRNDDPMFISRIQHEAEAKGHAKGLSEAKRRSTTVVVGGKAKQRYDPGRYNFMDDEPLDLP